MEYALKYQANRKGLIICNMSADFDTYEAYNKQLRSPMRPLLIDTLNAYETKGEYHNPDYVNLVYAEYYTKH